MVEPSARRPSLLPIVAIVALCGVLAFLGLTQYRLGRQIEELQAVTQSSTTTLQQVLGEVTRMRIEQSAGSKGPQALLEKLRTFAPLLASARTAEPDFRSAQKEMDAVLRAFGTLGQDGWKPIQERLLELKPEKDFDEIKQLLRASVAVDAAAGVQQLKDILLGRKLPSPRLRWYAAALLTEHDRPLAQATLRQVLLTESHLGFSENHAASFPGAVIPDKAALSATGFQNFVVAYVRSGDPKMDDTLLMLLGRVEHDRTTIQECIKALGELRCDRAVDNIEKLYRNPPANQQDPIFMNYCLEALVNIRGVDAKPFLESVLPSSPSEIVTKRIQALLQRIATGQLAQPTTTAPKPDDKK